LDIVGALEDLRPNACALGDPSAEAAIMAAKKNTEAASLQLLETDFIRLLLGAAAVRSGR
jgi:hypothetical protein